MGSGPYCYINTDSIHDLVFPKLDPNDSTFQNLKEKCYSSALPDKVRVRVLRPVQQTGSYWHRSSVLPLVGSNPYRGNCLVLVAKLPKDQATEDRQHYLKQKFILFRHRLLDIFCNSSRGLSDSYLVESV